MISFIYLMVYKHLVKPLHFPNANQKQMGSPSEAWLLRCLPVSEGVFPCQCRPRLALWETQAKIIKNCNAIKLQDADAQLLKRLSASENSSLDEYQPLICKAGQ